MPPSASMNLPVWRSVAPVNAPFSWPNRMLSTRLCGMAPQLTVTKGLLARSLAAWMARATISLPTPDSPSSTTGMLDCAARRPSSMTRSISGLAEMMSSKWMVSARLRRPARLRPSRWSILSALPTATPSRSGDTGFTTKSKAPARMAMTTVSIPPCPVCTMTGMVFSRSASTSRNAVPFISGIIRSSRITLIRPPLRSSRSRPARPFSAIWATWPERSIMFFRSLRWTGSSSMTRIWAVTGTSLPKACVMHAPGN